MPDRSGVRGRRGCESPYRLRPQRSGEGVGLSQLTPRTGPAAKSSPGLAHASGTGHKPPDKPRQVCAEAGVIQQGDPESPTGDGNSPVPCTNRRSSEAWRNRFDHRGKQPRWWHNWVDVHTTKHQTRPRAPGKTGSPVEITSSDGRRSKDAAPFPTWPGPARQQHSNAGKARSNDLAFSCFCAGFVRRVRPAPARCNVSNETANIALVGAGPIERAPSRRGTSTSRPRDHGPGVPWRTSRDTVRSRSDCAGAGRGGAGGARRGGARARELSGSRSSHPPPTDDSMDGRRAGVPVSPHSRGALPCDPRP